MTEHPAWADLPNAKYIDLVIDSLKKNPAAWAVAKNAAWKVAMDAAKSATWNVLQDAAWDTVWDAVWDAAKDAAWYAERREARGAALALIAWDNCGYLLEEKSEDVKMLALLGNHAAVLLYPACVALQNTKELEMA